MNEKKALRQGDLLFLPITKEDYQLRNLDKRDSRSGFQKDGIIQHGEATGHHHSIEDLMKADVYRPQWGEPIIIVGSEPVRVLHGGSTEVDDRFHEPVTLEPNTNYRVHIAREEDPSGQI